MLTTSVDVTASRNISIPAGAPFVLSEEFVEGIGAERWRAFLGRSDLEAPPFPEMMTLSRNSSASLQRPRGSGSLSQRAGILSVDGLGESESHPNRNPSTYRSQMGRAVQSDHFARVAFSLVTPPVDAQRTERHRPAQLALRALALRQGWAIWPTFDDEEAMCSPQEEHQF